MRVGKRKNADGTVRLVKETAKVSLLLPDGKEFQGKKREIDQKIEEIIGLDAGQFTQIAMIAQGDFLKLLHAGSKERKKIFSRIFQTQIYWRMQEELKEQGKALYVSLKENEADIRREMERSGPGVCRSGRYCGNLAGTSWKRDAAGGRSQAGVKQIIKEGGDLARELAGKKKSFRKNRMNSTP